PLLLLSHPLSLPSFPTRRSSDLFFATFPSTDEAGNAVSEIIASGIVPAAIEMLDRLAIVAAKAATGVDWPDVGAALLMDVDGPLDRKSTRLNSSHEWISYAVFGL